MPASDRQCDVAIIGAGIVGLAVGLDLVRRIAGTRLLVLEKEQEVAAHQTGHNSGVIHSGLYYKPGSLKARLCVEGAAAMVRFCREYGIPHEVCGKVVVATEEHEIPQLRELLHRGQTNGLQGLRELDPDQIREIEPYCAGARGIYVPSTGITSFKLVAQQYAALIREAGGEILFGHAVERIAHESSCLRIPTIRQALSELLGQQCGKLVLKALILVGGERHIVWIGADSEHLRIDKLDRQFTPLHALGEQFSR